MKLIRTKPYRTVSLSVCDLWPMLYGGGAGVLLLPMMLAVVGVVEWHGY